MTELSTTPEKKSTDFLSRPLWLALNLDWEKALYIAFIVIAIVTRIWGLGDRVVSHDESLHTQYSYQFYNGDGYRHTPLMHGPFLFHITALSYWLFGPNDFTARLPVALLGVLLVAFPYFLRRWLGQKGALITSFLFLISPYITYYARYIRHDTPVIIWALITFTAIVSYIYLDRAERYLWWLAGGVALMFATKEVSYIYIAIFGSFIVLRLMARISADGWLQSIMTQSRQWLFVGLIGGAIIGGGFLAERQMTAPTTDETATPEDASTFAADPDAEATATPIDSSGVDATVTFLRWLQVAGVGLIMLGLFQVANHWRLRLAEYAEFDLIVIFTALVLPTVAPVLATISGWQARDYSTGGCTVSSDQPLTALQTALAQLSGECIGTFLSSGIVHVGFFLILLLAIGLALGIWWDRDRFLTIAIIFHSIFIFFFTSAFTNLPGWTSGMVDSLAYWIEQQEVQRGSQPYWYYLLVFPFYEFLPLSFSLLAMRRWLRQKKINKVVGYWLVTLLLALFVYSLTNWMFNLPVRRDGGITTNTPGIVGAVLVLGISLLFWLLNYAQQLRREYGLGRTWRGLVNWEDIFGFVPLLIWWTVLNWAIYSFAGEKMPWLSIHFVIPCAMLAGWYINDVLREQSDFFSRANLMRIGVSLVFIVAAMLALGPLLLGRIEISNQTAGGLSSVGRFLGSLVVAGGVFYGWQLLNVEVGRERQRHNWLAAIFLLLSLLTIRFTYMANFPNADYTNEFLVYAHGAPQTKEQVLPQLEELSIRLHGDNSLRIAYDNDSSWPYTWYLRDFPNRVFFGESPDRSILESPAVLVGDINWGKVEPLLGDEYEAFTYTFLWWPMEDYRDIGWDAIFGVDIPAELSHATEQASNPNVEIPEPVRRGLGNADVRQALWDIFFYRDYTRYGEVFGGSFTNGQWPLRRSVRLYIRKDVLGQLWDHGLGTTAFAPAVDPFEGGLLDVQPERTFGSQGTAPGQLQGPRNIAIGPTGNIYVLDSDNHRVQVFDANGAYLYGWGSRCDLGNPESCDGAGAGQFNQPWGLAVDDEFVYVADTWNHRIQKFTLDGEFVLMFGQSGAPTETDNAGGRFFGPRAIVLLGDDQLIVTDTGNHRLQVFDRAGNFQQQIGGYGFGFGQFYEPVGMAFNPVGQLYLVDTWNQRVQIFSADLFNAGQFPVETWEGDNINNKPYVAIDSSGRVYLTDPQNNRILIFSPQGAYLGRFGQPGSDANGLNLPTGIAIDGDDNVYITDAGNNRVHVYSAANFANLLSADLFMQPELPDLPDDLDGMIEDGEAETGTETETETESGEADSDTGVDEEEDTGGSGIPVDDPTPQPTATPAG